MWACSRSVLASRSMVRPWASSCALRSNTLGWVSVLIAIAMGKSYTLAHHGPPFGSPIGIERGIDDAAAGARVRADGLQIGAARPPVPGRADAVPKEQIGLFAADDEGALEQTG